jgi:DNA-binding XRE family transcriptional regulator
MSGPSAQDLDQPTPTADMARAEQPPRSLAETDQRDTTMTDLIATVPGNRPPTTASRPEPLPALVPAGPRSSAARRWIVVIDGQRLRELRLQGGLSQEMLADRAGVSAGTVGRLERHGRPTCRGRTLARLAAALGERPAAMTPPSQPS